MTRPKISERAGRLEPYVPGKTPEEIAGERGLYPSEVVKLSSNENPLGPPGAALEALANMEEVHRYPSTEEVRSFEEAAAEFVGVPRENIVATPGADGAIEYLCRLFLEVGDLAMSPVPTFQYYRPSVVLTGASFSGFETRKEDGYRVTEELVEGAGEREPEMVFLCSPNNPTGVEVGDRAFMAALEGDPLVLIDEAYAEFSSGGRAPMVPEHDDLVVVRTMSKAFGLAGLRVGYAVVPEWIKREISRVATPFSVSSAAMAAGRAAFEEGEHLRRTVDLVERGRRFLAREFPFRAIESGANFVSFDVSPMIADEVEDGLLDRGVIVRSCSAFPGETDSLVRVTIGTDDENRRAVEAAEDLVSRH